MSGAIDYGRHRFEPAVRGCNGQWPAGSQVEDRPGAGCDSGAAPLRAAGEVKCRLIQPTDLEEIAKLLHEGFPRRSKARWLAALGRLGSHPGSNTFPTYGYMLETGEVAVGVLLLIYTSLDDEQSRRVRCNVSGWYVRPAFRMFAPLMVSRTIKDRSVTYVNVSPAPKTWPVIEAQGFRRFCNGSFAAIPMLSLRSEPCTITRITKSHSFDNRLTSLEWRILRDHANYGCVSLCLDAAGGDAFPFVFRRRLFKSAPLPCAQLVYCRDRNDLARFARPLGRFLALRGMLWVLVGADAPIINLTGRYFDNKLPMYFLGASRPSPGELAYTEAAMFGL